MWYRPEPAETQVVFLGVGIPAPSLFPALSGFRQGRRGCCLEPPKLKVIKHDLGMETEKAYLIPLSDLHIGADFNEDKFLGYRQWILDRPEAYCVILGDVIDNAVTDSIGDTYGTLRPKQQKELALKFLEPLARAGKILAWLD